ncbi:MAG: hypothetical protein RL748_2183 [Pseudomonadota bacterium]
MSSDQDLTQIQAGVAQLHSAVERLATNPLRVAPVQVCPVTAPTSTGCPFHPIPQFVPDFNIPLLAPGGGDTNPKILAKLGPLAGLVGTWVSGKTNGFNVMPIPQATAPNGFILKNLFYYEVMTFSAIQGKVANRGGVDEQDCYTLFYEQRVFFSDGPQANQLVHAENGAWLNLITGPQGQGPQNCPPNIPSPPAPNPIPPQNPARQIVKQVSVPHGNSILALGAVSIIDGAPPIPDVNALPQDAPPGYAAPYGTNIPSNPNINPNIVLQDALSALGQMGVNVLRTHVIEVDSNNRGGVSNIPFIKRHTDVSQFTNTLWLEELSNGQLLLQYSQNISLNFPQADGSSLVFPHITANTLTKVK